MTSVEDAENLVGRLINLIDEGAMVTKFVLIAEGLDTEGKSAIYTSTHTNATWMDTTSLLIYGLEKEKTKIRKLFDEE